MRILLIRHGIAEDRERFAKSGHADELRPLTVDGRKKMRKVADGIVKLVPKLDLIATSTLVRAVETGQIVARAFDAGRGGHKVKVVEARELEPGTAGSKLVKWIARHAGVHVLALVGHEPDLSELAGTMVGGTGRPILALKKGGACLSEIDDPSAPATGKICCLLTPRQLRKIA